MTSGSNDIIEAATLVLSESAEAPNSSSLVTGRGIMNGIGSGVSAERWRGSNFKDNLANRSWETTLSSTARALTKCT